MQVWTPSPPPARRHHRPTSASQTARPTASRSRPPTMSVLAPPPLRRLELRPARWRARPRVRPKTWRMPPTAPAWSRCSGRRQPAPGAASPTTWCEPLRAASDRGMCRLTAQPTSQSPSPSRKLCQPLRRCPSQPRTLPVRARPRRLRASRLRPVLRPCRRPMSSPPAGPRPAAPWSAGVRPWPQAGAPSLVTPSPPRLAGSRCRSAATPRSARRSRGLRSASATPSPSPRRMP
jgi:hypothetical protein